MLLFRASLLARNAVPWTCLAVCCISQTHTHTHTHAHARARTRTRARARTRAHTHTHTHTHTQMPSSVPCRGREISYSELLHTGCQKRLEASNLPGWRPASLRSCHRLSTTAMAQVPGPRAPLPFDHGQFTKFTLIYIKEGRLGTDHLSGKRLGTQL